MTLCSDFTADAFVGADAGRNDQTAAILFHIGFRTAVCRCMGNVFGRFNHIAGRINHCTFLINIAVCSDGGVAAGVDVGYMRCICYGSCICFGTGNADRYTDACNVIFSYAVADTPKSVTRPDSVTVLLPLDATILTSLAAEMLTDSSPLIWLPLTVTFELEDNWVFLPVKMLPFRPTEWVSVWVSVN